MLSDEQAAAIVRAYWLQWNRTPIDKATPDEIGLVRAAYAAALDAAEACGACDCGFRSCCNSDYAKGVANCVAAIRKMKGE